jgi:hypothetical protein
MSLHKWLQVGADIKHYRNNPKTKPNVVVFILEGYGGNISAFNKDARCRL